MKKILLFDTAIGTSNFGDEIIFQSVVEAFNPLFNESMVFRLGTHIQNYTFLQLLKPNWKIRDTNLNVDYKFIAGTNLIQNDLLRLKPQFMLSPSNKRLVENAVFVSVGRNKDFHSFSNHYTKELYKRTFSHEYIHSTRDEETKEVLESIGLKAINTGCSTLWGITDDFCKDIPKKKSSSCVITVSGNTKYLNPEADKHMVETVRKKYDKVYAWIQTPLDLKYLKDLIDIEENRIECIYSLSKYHDILESGGVDYIGTRLHGGCFAIRHKVRTIIISIDQRSAGIHKANNIPILLRSEIDSLEEMIETEWSTDIHVDQNAVDTFLSQFKS